MRRASDAAAVRALRLFVMAAEPLLTGPKNFSWMTLPDQADGGKSLASLRAKAGNKLANVQRPGSDGWAEMDLDSRVRWWTHRVGAVASALAATPVVRGPIMGRIPLKEAVTAAGAGTVVCGIASEYGVNARDERVVLLARVLLNRDLDPALLSTNEDDLQRSAEALNAGLRVPTTSKAELARSVWELGTTLVPLLREHANEQASSSSSRSLSARMVRRIPVVGAFSDTQGYVVRIGEITREWLEANGARDNRKRRFDRADTGAMLRPDPVVTVRGGVTEVDEPVGVSSRRPQMDGPTGPPPSRTSEVPVLNPNYFEDALRAAGKPVTLGNVVAVAGLFSANLALNANRWLEVVGTPEVKARWSMQFRPVERPEQMICRPDDMIDFLWGVTPRLHPGIRDVVKQMKKTIIDACQSFGSELPLDMWSAAN